MIAETKRPKVREEGVVYIDELAVIINRQQGTIRKWELTGKLPKNMLPHRGKRNWRYWTDSQVWGPNGIVAWMEENDMRPGNLVADPNNVDEHIRNLRRPKYLNGYHLRSARAFVASGKSRAWIVETLWPRTKYARPENLEAALVKVFASNGWYFPPHVKRKLPERIEREMVRYEEKFEQIAARSNTPVTTTTTIRRRRRR